MSFISSIHMNPPHLEGRFSLYCKYTINTQLTQINRLKNSPIVTNCDSIILHEYHNTECPISKH